MNAQSPLVAPILVTGSHRSGSTWAGNMLSLAPGLGYIHEPFNLNHRPGICRQRCTCWYQHVDEENEAGYAEALRDCLAFRYNLVAAWRAVRSARDAAILVRDAACFAAFRLQRRRPLVKDPLALFSAPWLARRFNMRVVALVRHPAAFAGSLKEAHWPHPFAHFLRQPRLMATFPAALQAQVAAAAERDPDLIAQAVLLWNLTSHALWHYRQTQPDWLIVRHEDLSADPVGEYAAIYEKLGLKFTARVERQLGQHSFADRSSRLKRDSRANIVTWKKRLSTDEIRRIREGTEELAAEFYRPTDW